MAFEPNQIIDKLKSADWKSVGLKSGLPLATGLLIGGLLFGGGSSNSATPTYGTDIILSAVDLPSQISKLQNSELSYVENSLKVLGENITIDNNALNSYTQEDKASLVLATLNYDNNLNGFFKTLLSFDSSTSADSRYTGLVEFLENPYTDSNSSKESERERETMLAFLNAQSWATETNSQTALAGNVIPALLTGSTDDERLFYCIVPTTNGNRQFKNLAYIVTVGKNKKVKRAVYHGEINNNADLEDWFGAFESVLTDNVGEFLYLQQPKYEEQKAKQNQEFLEKIKSAFKLEKDGDTKRITLKGDKIELVNSPERTLGAILQEDYGLTKEQIEEVAKAINNVQKTSSKKEEENSAEVKEESL